MQSQDEKLCANRTQEKDWCMHLWFPQHWSCCYNPLSWYHDGCMQSFRFSSHIINIFALLRFQTCFLKIKAFSVQHFEGARFLVLFTLGQKVVLFSFIQIHYVKDMNAFLYIVCTCDVHLRKICYELGVLDNFQKFSGADWNWSMQCGNSYKNGDCWHDPQLHFESDRN